MTKKLMLKKLLHYTSILCYLTRHVEDNIENTHGKHDFRTDISRLSAFFANFSALFLHMMKITLCSNATSSKVINVILRYLHCRNRTFKPIPNDL